MKFNVSAPQGKMPVEFKFATDADLHLLRNWKSKKPLQNNPHVQDALEYSRLAGKRWRTYSKSKRIATSIEELQQTIDSKPTSEIVFVLVVAADWHLPSKILGFCFCRRSWCNHLIIDFASSHPNAIRSAGGHIRGVGGAMVYSLTHLANQIGISLIWGEATENSAEFYRHILKNAAISDHFFIAGRTFQRCLVRFEDVKIVEAA